MTQDPFLIELDDGDAGADALDPGRAAPVPDEETGLRPDETAAMARVAALAAGRRRSALARWFWGLASGVVIFAVSLWAWDALTRLLVERPLLGWIGTALVLSFALVCLAIALKELAAFARLRRVDGLRRSAEQALADYDLAAARAVTHGLDRLYAGRPDAEWGRARLAGHREAVLDADGLIGVAERDLLAPLDARATREIEAAARQVATVTALVPLALADLIAALTSNLRMIRRIAEIYGGRAGTLGSWRLTRAVLSHLVATGMVAVGDDLIGSVAGGSLLSKVSRRFGEGVVNGALTARVGVAAMEVCRPLPFTALERPSVTGLVRRALSGLFSSADKAAGGGG